MSSRAICRPETGEYVAPAALSGHNLPVSPHKAALRVQACTVYPAQATLLIVAITLPPSILNSCRLVYAACELHQDKEPGLYKPAHNLQPTTVAAA